MSICLPSRPLVPLLARPPVGLKIGLGCRLGSQLVSRLAAACALMLSLSACSHPPRWAGDSGTAPLPPGWSQDQTSVAPRALSAAPWGVPAFEPPSATHCRGPQRLREQPGRMLQSYLSDSGSVPTAAAPMAPAPARSEARRIDGAAAKAIGESAAVGTTAAAAAATDRSAAPALAQAMPPMQPRSAVVPVPPAQRDRRQAEQVSAGMVDDNAAFAEYQAYRLRAAHLNPRDRDSAERYRIELRDAAGRPAADAEVALSWPGARESLRFARTDSAGLVWLQPRALMSPELLSVQQALEVQVRSSTGEVVRVALQRGQKSAVQLQFRQPVEAPRRTPMDLVFLVDATGSMGDEIHKLRESLRTIADRVGALASQPDLCWGLVAYRDRGDAFLTRTHDLTNDLGAFQQSLTRLQAGGGGDYPEALNEALDEAVHRVDWRGAGTSRLLVLLADAPPHFNRGGPYHDEAAAAALARGIKLHAVGASGLDAQGEAVFRQLAQSTGGRFVFLTYRDAHRPSSGPGRETTHDVRDYSVDTLDELIVRLVREELAPRGQP